MKITFLGDVMLARMIGSKYRLQPYQFVSEEIVSQIASADFVVANLESPLSIDSKTDGDHLSFDGNPDTLEQLKWINCFSLANNHINDCGTLGMDETVSILQTKGFLHNGLFKKEYEPIVFQQENLKVAMITLTDMLNIPFDDDCAWKVLRMGDEKVFKLLNQYKEAGYVVLLFAHVGMLFTRFPNPVTYSYLHQCVDNGADAIITVHSHCLGGTEYYKGKPIFHSLGDFVMDGSSFRRRQAGMLHLDIEESGIIKWDLTPTIINYDLITVLPNETKRKKMLKSYEFVSSKLNSGLDKYEAFYKMQYKKEIFIHSCSTIHFLLRTRGIKGFTKLLFQRAEEVFRTIRWMCSDRSKVQRDDDAIDKNRKKISQEKLFKN